MSEQRKPGGSRLSPGWTPVMALIRREFLERVRTPSHFILRSLTTLAMFLLVLVVAEEILSSDWDNGMMRAPQHGRDLFSAFAMLQFALVLLLAPLLTAGALVDERKEGSLSLLLLTELSHFQIGASKFLSRLGLLTLMVLGQVPVLSFTLMLGGVEPIEMVKVFTITCSALAFSIGVTLMASAVARSMVTAALVGYAAQGATLALISPPVLDVVGFEPFVHVFAPLTLGMTLFEPLAHPNAWWIASLVNAGVGFLMLCLAVERLRRGDRRVHKPRRRRVLAPERAWHNAIAWREVVLGDARWGTLALIVASSLGAAMIVLVVGEVSSDTRVLAGLVAVGASSIYALALGASAFVEEKRARSLELLQLTRLTPRQIVLGKLALLGRPWLYFALGLVVFVGACSVVEPSGLWFAVAPMVLLGLTTVVVFFGAVGLFYSAVAPNILRAAVPAIATVMFVMTLPLWYELGLDGYHYSVRYMAVFLMLQGLFAALLPMWLFAARHNPTRAAWTLLWVVLWAAFVLYAPEAVPMLLDTDAYNAHMHLWPPFWMVESLLVGTREVHGPGRALLTIFYGCLVYLGLSVIILQLTTALFHRRPPRDAHPWSEALIAAPSVVMLFGIEMTFLPMTRLSARLGVAITLALVVIVVAVRWGMLRASSAGERRARARRP